MTRKHSIKFTSFSYIYTVFSGNIPKISVQIQSNLISLVIFCCPLQFPVVVKRLSSQQQILKLLSSSSKRGEGQQQFQFTHTQFYTNYLISFFHDLMTINGIIIDFRAGQLSFGTFGEHVGYLRPSNLQPQLKTNGRINKIMWEKETILVKESL